MKGPSIEELSRWAGILARMSQKPKRIKVKPSGRKFNRDQECARRRRFHKTYGTAIGGGAIWPQ